MEVKHLISIDMNSFSFCYIDMNSFEINISHNLLMKHKNHRNLVCLVLVLRVFPRVYDAAFRL